MLARKSEFTPVASGNRAGGAAGYRWPINHPLCLEGKQMAVTTSDQEADMI